MACLTGCGYKVAKLQKYEPGVDLTPQALLVVKINALDYLDIKRVEDTKENPVANNTAQTTTTTTASTEEKPTESKDLRKLFDHKQAANADSNALALAVTEYRISKPNSFFRPFSYSHEIYSIEPGTYYISLVGNDFEQGIYYSEAPGINKDGVIAYGAFQVKAGEVVYLGDIECQWHSTNKVKKIQVLDKLAAVKKDLQDAGMHQLAARIVPTRFYSQGINIKNIE